MTLILQNIDSSYTFLNFALVVGLYIWRKHKKNVYKDWDKKLSDEDWHLLWDDFDYRDFSYCTLAPIEISKINKILYGVELEDK